MKYLCVACVLAVCVLLTAPSVEGWPRRGGNRGREQRRPPGGTAAQTRNGEAILVNGDPTVRDALGGKQNRCQARKCNDSDPSTYEGISNTCSPLPDICEGEGGNSPITHYCSCLEPSDCDTARNYICYKHPSWDTFLGFCVHEGLQDTCSSITSVTGTEYCPSGCKSRGASTSEFARRVFGRRRGSRRGRDPATTATPVDPVAPAVPIGERLVAGGSFVYGSPSNQRQQTRGRSP